MSSICQPNPVFQAKLRLPQHWLVCKMSHSCWRKSRTKSNIDLWLLAYVKYIVSYWKTFSILSFVLMKCTKNWYDASQIFLSGTVERLLRLLRLSVCLCLLHFSIYYSHLMFIFLKAVSDRLLPLLSLIVCWFVIEPVHGRCNNRFPKLGSI